MTLADRLLAGEHLRFRTWQEFCAHVGCCDSALRKARRKLAAKGHRVELGFITKPDKPTAQPGVTARGGAHEGEPQVTKRAGHEVLAYEPAWANVEKYDEICTPEEQAADNQAAHSLAPEGYSVKGVSTLYDASGLVKQRWVKTNKQQDDNRKWVLDAIANICEGWPARPDESPPPEYSDDDLLCVYPMGDPHIGMLSWAPETGENFDLAIAERNLVNAVDHLVRLAPPAKRALLVTVGDTFHSDGLNNATTKGTRVDVDGRTRKMIDVGVRTFRRLIDLTLKHHDETEVKIAPGNHDALISIFLQVALAQFYENEPRVRIDPSPESFLWYRFGANLLGVNHGHLATPDALMQAMAVDCAEDWGQTKHRRIYKGHLHHEITKEVPGCTVDTLNTLASSDDWHRRSAYRSTRHMRMDIFHRRFGLINRHIVGIQQLVERAA